MFCPAARVTGIVPGEGGAVWRNPGGTTSERTYVPAARPGKEKSPAAVVVEVVVCPAAFLSWIVTPASGGSPASRTPLPLTSLNLVPEIEPVAAASDWFPKRKPVAFCAGAIVIGKVPGAAGAVCLKPLGTTSESV